jgi:hypothetical protein
VQVGGFALHGNAKQIINMHSALFTRNWACGRKFLRAPPVLSEVVATYHGAAGKTIRLATRAEPAR